MLLLNHLKFMKAKITESKVYSTVEAVQGHILHYSSLA